MARLLISAFMLAGMVGGGWLAATSPWRPERTFDFVESFGDWEARSKRAGECEEVRWLEIRQRGVRVFRRMGYRFSPGINYKRSGCELGRPITSRSSRNFFVHEEPKGWDSTILLFDLDDPALLVQEIEGLVAPHLQDVDGDGLPEIVAYEGSYIDWRETCPPAPRVVLKSDGRRFCFDPGFGTIPPPAESYVQSVARRAIAWEDHWGPWGPPDEVVCRMLDFIYGGQSAAAWKLLDLAWKADRPGREEWERALSSKIIQSRYGRFLPVEWTFRPPPISKNEAWDRLLKHPQVAAWFAYVRSIGDPQVRPIAFLDSGPGPDNRTRAWRFYVGSDHGTHTSVFRWVEVDSTTGSVSFLDLADPDVDVSKPGDPRQ